MENPKENRCGEVEEEFLQRALLASKTSNNESKSSDLGFTP